MTNLGLQVKFVPQSEAKQAANYILDVSHPKCNIEYNVPANPTGIDEATVQVVLPHDTRFFQLWGHIHMAGYNISLFHGKTVCDHATLPVPIRPHPGWLQPPYCPSLPPHRRCRVSLACTGGSGAVVSLLTHTPDRHPPLPTGWPRPRRLRIR